MKAYYKGQLIKDVIIAAVAWLISALIFSALLGQSFLYVLPIGFLLAGIPFGWKFLSKIFVALSFQAILTKALLSILIGWVALPIVLIKDIISLKTAEA